MKITIERSFGKVEVEHSDSKDLIKDMSFWQSLPNQCPKCQTDLNLFFRSPQDNDYYGLVCSGKTRHECNFGQYKKGGLYYKNEWHDAYTGYIAERDAEIAAYDKSARGTLLERINSAKVAIKGLGGQLDNVDLSAFSNERLESYINELNNKYKQLKGATK